jgi:hypothetical protein
MNIALFSSTTGTTVSIFCTFFLVLSFCTLFFDVPIFSLIQQVCVVLQNIQILDPNEYKDISVVLMTADKAIPIFAMTNLQFYLHILIKQNSKWCSGHSKYKIISDLQEKLNLHHFAHSLQTI